MANPRRILLVEDSADDAALLERELRRAGVDAEFQRVETSDQLRHALKSFNPSLIISDYQLPQFSAPLALRVVQESGLDLPFIVVSGRVGEDSAVEMMKAGAHDYVMKMNLTRLSAAIRRELHEAFIRAERNQAEAALRKAHRYLERAQEVARLGSWVYTLEGSEPMIWSEQTYRIFGLKSDEFDGSPETLFSFTHPEEQKRVSEARQLAIEGEAPYALDHRIVLRDGSIRWVHEEAVVERDGSGKPLRMVGAVMDITARKHAEEELRRSETLFARLAESGVIGILVSDVFGRIQDANQPLLRMLGYSRSELLEKLTLPELTPPEWWHVDDLAVEQLKTKGSVPPWEKEYRRKDGSRVSVLVGMAMLDSAQRISFVLDISERKRLEEEQKKTFQLEEQTRRAQEANQFKSKFVANMSHELRTPLNAVIGFSELLEQEILGPLTTRQKEYVQNILTSGQHLLSLVNDVLDIAKVEAGRMELAREWTSLAGVVESVERILQSLARKKQVTLELSVSHDLPDVFIDPVRMKQILYNLLANGIKFTPAGGVVHLGVRVNEGHLQLSVDDTGIGMQPDQLSRLFKPFEQLHERGAANIEGTGLGLALTKSLVELHGGMITVRSEVGRGSSFKVMLPMRSAVLEGLPEQMGSLSEGLILVVGNDAGAVELLSRHIRALGLSMATSPTADSALQIACELRPLAVILDLQTPRIDESWAMVARVKNHPAISNVPVIVFSVIPEPNRALYLGAMDYLVKPQTREQLAECLGRVGVKTYALEGVRILLVGQFNDDLAALASGLKEAGCQVRAVSKLDPQDFAKQPADAVIGSNLAVQRGDFEGGACPAALINLADSSASPGGGSGSPPMIDLPRADALRLDRLVRVVHRAVQERERGPATSGGNLLSHLRELVAKAASQSKKFAIIAVQLPPQGSDGEWIATLKSRLRPEDFIALTREDVLVLVAAGVEGEEDGLRLTLRLKDLLWSIAKLRPARVQLLWYPAHGTSAEELVQRCIEHSALEARQ